MKQITIRVDDRIANLLEKFGNHTKGATISSEIFPRLREISLSEIKGVFAANELSAMVDNTNATMMDPQFMGKQFLVIHLQDGDKYEGLADKWSVNLSSLIEKINKLPDALVFILHFELFAFWNTNLYSNNLNKFIDTLK